MIAERKENKVEWVFVCLFVGNNDDDDDDC